MYAFINGHPEDGLQGPKHAGGALQHKNICGYMCSSSSSSLGTTALREPWPPLLFASTGLYPELFFSILQSPSVVGPLERHLAI
jgi:hypothetical protein